jgi:hypothetical protein
METPVEEIIESKFGYKAWYVDGRRHRTDGPAVIYDNGDEFWYARNQFHRTDGPAVIRHYGEHEWWINGDYFSFNEWLKESPLCDEQKAMLKLKYA